MNETAATFDFIWDAEQDEPPSLSIETFVPQLLNELNLIGVELSIAVLDDDRVRALNREYRGKDRATDVLSFPHPEDAAIPGLDTMGPRHLGDIVIGAQTADRQAHEIGHGLQPEIRFLILHGLLHLLGYDHETDNGEMMARQSELKDRLKTYF